MLVKTSKCLIQLGPMTIIPKEVWPWEAEVLKEKFGGSCDIHGEGEAEISELPDADGEFARLQDAHGIEEETKISWVQNTYGRGKAGLKELEKAINASPVKAKPGPKAGAKKAASKKPAKVELPVSTEKVDPEADPLA